MKDYYAILGVPREAEADLIKATYIALSKIYHPDIYRGDKKYALKRMQEINEAHEILKTLKKEKLMMTKIKIRLMIVFLMTINFKMNKIAIKK